MSNEMKYELVVINEQTKEVNRLIIENERLRDLVRDACVEGRLASGAAENWVKQQIQIKGYNRMESIVFLDIRTQTSENVQETEKSS